MFKYYIHARRKNNHARYCTQKPISLDSNITQSRSVLINRNKGTITDPIDLYDKVEKSDIGLQKIGITNFHSVYALKRKELSEKSRRGLQKRLILPFFLRLYVCLPPYSDHILCSRSLQFLVPLRTEESSFIISAAANPTLGMNSPSTPRVEVLKILCLQYKVIMLVLF